ncbi:hypothetical protein ACQP2E_20825 [Actinoplanes sp. CA-015351]|uniref:hypothetical protein n=1 Tax=Actinoplanes sp. CA-015351 TaxID=3239897 RepID=UPI003D973568
MPEDEILKNEVIKILAEALNRYSDALFFLTKQCKLAADRIPPETDFQATAFWDRVYREFEFGATVDGLLSLARAVSARWPGNRTFRQFLEEETQNAKPGPDANPDPDPEPASPRPGPPSRTESRSWRRTESRRGPAPGRPPGFSTLEIFGSDNFHVLWQTVQQSDPGAEWLYTAEREFAALVSDTGVADDVRRRLKQRLPGEQINVDFNVYEFRPCLLYRLTVIGPDHQQFLLSSQPSTTRVSEIPQFVLDQYGDDRIDGQRVRTVVDLLSTGPNGQDRRRLDPRHTLAEAEVPDGGTLLVATEVIAGFSMKAQNALARARNQIGRFSRSHDEFVLLDQRPKGLPTEYDVELLVPGIERRADGPPRTTGKHRISIQLLADYPDKAPFVQWLTPIYHPNVGSRRVTGTSESIRILCLGFLQKFYEPGLDLNYLCQMIVDVARCRNYSLPEELDRDTPGEFDREALTWFLTPDGQAMIVSIDGATVEELQAHQYEGRDTPRTRSSRISRIRSDPS